ncbi:methyltransferase domain-containing protein [Paenibacillus sp. HJL G12]|uniref:Methyltransferase domain-containing protein n=1 Tax=Paenibacillus dendrobii TaxID=2691084 RepID=A0A7X3LHU6_9BACL|nr:class I SAM-dependent methyltransferase [Paenibacillus dendrobii]MWV43624.1 methyltransferase domain-containing protein [Paenibacillus dendrobii]
MNSEQFEAARQSEADYHQRFYEENDIFQDGTWMSEPGPVVMDMLERLLLHKDDLTVLDLGCGVGRNTIPVAERLKGSLSKIKGVDLLEDAAAKLRSNADEFGVGHLIEAEAADVEHYPIAEDAYDYILACSCLEHTSSMDALQRTLDAMQKGTKLGGIHCITMSTEVEEVDRTTGENTKGLIELNIPQQEALDLLDHTYEEWNVLIKQAVPQSIEEEKDGRHIDFRCNLVTYVAQKIQ